MRLTVSANLGIKFTEQIQLTRCIATVHSKRQPDYHNQDRGSHRIANQYSTSTHQTKGA